MILSEPEARTKVCPLMSHRVKVNGFVEPILAEALCLASGCMKWRWAPDRSPEEREARAGWMGSENVGEPMGYCGA